MRFLLDSHALIWWWLESPSLSVLATERMSDPEAIIHVSPVSIIEIAIKVRRGQLDLAEPLASIEDDFPREGFIHLPIDHLDARAAGLLPGRHGDPFDRLIAAQALRRNLTVITRDPEIASFGCRTLW